MVPCGCVCLWGWVKEVKQGMRTYKGKKQYGFSKEGAKAVIKCPAGIQRGLPRPRAMLMSTPSGQGSLISACWTTWLERRSTGGLTSLQMTNSFPEEMVIPLIRTHWIGITSLYFSIISHLLDLIHTHCFFFCSCICLPSSLSYYSCLHNQECKYYYK